MSHLRRMFASSFSLQLISGFAVNEMSSRIDNLENSIQEFMSTGIEGSSPTATSAPKR